MDRTALIRIACATLLVAGGALADPPRRMVVEHARIFTANPAHPWAEAIAIEGDRIVAVGTNDEIAPLARRHHTTVYDAGGRLVIPGLNDAHVHVLVPPVGAYLHAPDFAPGPGPAQPPG